MITIYGTEKCYHCLKAKQMAQLFRLEYEFKSLNEIENKKEFFKITKNVNAVPQILWDGELLVGYQEFCDKIDQYVLNLEKEG